MMLRACLASLSFALLPVSTALPQQPAAAPQTFAITGTVVEHGTSRPLKDAIVTVAPVQAPGESISYRTDPDGRFTFARLQPGKYSIAARKRGFPPRNFQQDEQYSTAIAVGPGLDSEHIVFPLAPAASITGTVVDEENEPVAHAQALLFSKGVSSGASQITVQNQRSTDSAGAFRFSDLAPGTYFVAIQAHPWYAQANPTQFQQPANEQTNSNAELDVAYPLTYYPSVTDPVAASAITVTEGSSTHLQIALRPVPALHVQIAGLQINTNTGIGCGVMQLGLGNFQLQGNFQINFNGQSLEISGLAPGRYLLSPQVSQSPQVSHFVPSAPGDGRNTLQEQSQPEHNLSGVFDLSGNESLDLSAFNRTSLTGRITFEGNGAAAPNPRVFLHAPGGRGVMLSAAQDGTLKLEPGSTLLPGRYQFTFQGFQGLYLKSIEAKGATMSAGELDIPNAASVQLSLVIASGLTSINGVAMKDDKPFPGAMVLLIPKDFSRADFIRRDQSDSDGTFTLADVAPGRYTLLAIDDGHDLEYQDPATMKPYLGRGTALAAPLSNQSPARVEVLPRR